MDWVDRQFVHLQTRVRRASLTRRKAIRWRLLEFAGWRVGRRTAQRHLGVTLSLSARYGRLYAGQIERLPIRRRCSCLRRVYCYPGVLGVLSAASWGRGARRSLGPSERAI